MSFFGSLFRKKEVLNPPKAASRLSAPILAFTSTPEEKLALAKELLCHAQIDFKHEYHYPKGIDPNLRNDIDFSMYSKKLLDLYNQQEAETEAHQKLLESDDYNPMDYSDENLSNLDLFEITPIFNSMVRNLNTPKDRFNAKLLIIDDILQS
ncbi:hypothetical protein [Acinetobacter pseudolwoffii]|uniref:hypothetical protein n=1 Tax=Acinetobacter pseudolwoffii TaxID=2053287 RepID=UPI002574AAD3|nr:hypothetical protein [Acinetobacter pseudolwoffii]